MRRAWLVLLVLGCEWPTGPEEPEFTATFRKASKHPASLGRSQTAGGSQDDVCLVAARYTAMVAEVKRAVVVAPLGSAVP